MDEKNIKRPFWSFNIEEVFRELNTGNEGISEEEVKSRIKEFGENRIEDKKRFTKLKIFFRHSLRP